MDAGQIVGSALILLIVTVSSVCAVVNARAAERRRRPAPPPAEVFQEDSDWTDADRYHGSRQWGR